VVRALEGADVRQVGQRAMGLAPAAGGGVEVDGMADGRVEGLGGVRGEEAVALEVGECGLDRGGIPPGEMRQGAARQATARGGEEAEDGAGGLGQGLDLDAHGGPQQGLRGRGGGGEDVERAGPAGIATEGGGQGADEEGVAAGGVHRRRLLRRGEVVYEGAGDVVRQRSQREVVVPGAQLAQVGEQGESRLPGAVDDEDREGAGRGIAQEGEEEVEGGGVQPLGVVDGEDMGTGAHGAGDAGGERGRGGVVQERLEGLAQERLDQRAEGDEGAVGAEALAAGDVGGDVQVGQERGDERGLPDADRSVDLDDPQRHVGGRGQERTHGPRLSFTSSQHPGVVPS
jgi:hypothetical protein